MKPKTFIVLRQVGGPRWCVVTHGVRDGKRQFLNRIATAREYGPAARIAMDSARRMGLPLGIEGNGMMIRGFDPKRDAPEVRP